jgi:hypothetical protein
MFNCPDQVIGPEFHAQNQNIIFQTNEPMTNDDASCATQLVSNFLYLPCIHNPCCMMRGFPHTHPRHHKIEPVNGETFREFKLRVFKRILSHEIFYGEENEFVQQFINTEQFDPTILLNSGKGQVLCDRCTSFLSLGETVEEFITNCTIIINKNDPYKTLNISTKEELRNACISITIGVGGTVFGSSVAFLCGSTIEPDDLDITGNINVLINEFEKLFTVIPDYNPIYPIAVNTITTLTIMSMSGISTTIDIIAYDEYIQMGVDFMAGALQLSSIDSTLESSKINLRPNTSKDANLDDIILQTRLNITSFNDIGYKGGLNELRDTLTNRQMYSMLKAVYRLNAKENKGWIITGGLPSSMWPFFQYPITLNDFEYVINMCMYGGSISSTSVASIVANYIAPFSNYPVKHQTTSSSTDMVTSMSHDFEKSMSHDFEKSMSHDFEKSMSHDFEKSMSTNSQLRCSCNSTETPFRYLFVCPSCQSSECLECAVNSYGRICRLNIDEKIRQFKCNSCKAHS